MDFGHEQYDRLCILVTTAEATPAEFKRFDQHLRECVACQRSFAEYSDLVAAMLAESSPDDESAENSDRDPISLRLQSRKAQLLSTIKGGSYHPGLDPLRSLPQERRSILSRTWVKTIGVAAAILLIAAGVVLWRNEPNRPLSREPDQNVVRLPKLQPAAAPQAVNSRAPVDSLAIIRRDQEIQGQQGRISELNSLLTTLKTERDTLLGELEDARRNQAAAEQRTRDLESARKQSSAGLASMEGALADLNEKVRSQESLLARQQRLLAVDREVHTILGNPDLRILDVQTVNSRGDVEHPFGRVFYAPGKALLLYAFDLDQRYGSHSGDQFDVWGSTGLKMAGARRLGALDMDKKQENRWVLKYDDQTALASMDTIYVMVSGSGALAQAKPILRAYLDSSLGLK